MVAAIQDWLFDPAGLTPHGFCLLWQPGVVWLHAVAGLATGLAYLSIPLALALLARRRPDLRPRLLIWLFVAFITLCGVGHLLDVLTLWVAAYGVQGVLKGATALVSVATAIALWRLLPVAQAWPTPDQLAAAQHALAEAHERISFQLSPVPKCRLDADDRILEASDSLAALLGRPRAEVVGTRLDAFQPPGAPGWSAAERAGLAAGEVTHSETQFRHRDGAVIDALIAARAQPADGQVVCAVLDISDRKRAEAELRSTADQLQHLQKREAVGALAAGVAHDFNNTLQAVIGALETATDEMEPTDPARPYMTIAMQAAWRGSSLTQRLLAYARKQILRPVPIRLAPFLDELRALLGRTLGPHIAVSLHVSEEAAVLADPSQLETALLNLAINAAQAMPDGGRLRIEAQEAEEDGERRILLTMTDTGRGMDEATLARAMDPFFTTKGVEGTGLGLSMVQGFAEQSGGRLALMSVPGEGTSARLSLPACPVMPEPPAVAAGGRLAGTLLLVDDSAEVLATTGAYLERAGFAVLRAESGEAAMALLQAGGRVDLLVTDYAMPGMSGAVLIGLARQLQPDLHCLLISGYADLRHAAAIPPGTPVLRKPFRRGEMLEALARLLASSDGDGSTGLPAALAEGRLGRWR